MGQAFARLTSMSAGDVGGGDRPVRRRRATRGASDGSRRGRGRAAETPAGAQEGPHGEADRGLGGLGEFIRGQRQLARLSLRQMAELARVSNPYLSQVERGLYRPSADVLKAIADALHISAETMYARAGLLDASTEGGVEEAIYTDPYLSSDQKEALVRVYRGFVGESPPSA